MADPLSIEFEFRNKRYQDAAAGLRAFARTVNQSWDGSAKVLSRELQDFLLQVGVALERRHGNAWPGGTTSNTLSRRSGQMLESIISSIEVHGTTFTTITGTIGGSEIARVQEFGATITPKNAKYLTVPLPAALNANGTPKKARARDWEDTFVIRTKAGNLLIVMKLFGQIIPLYVLRTSVTIPPRLGMRATLQAGIPYFVDRVMDQLVKDIQKGGVK